MKKIVFLLGFSLSSAMVFAQTSQPQPPNSGDRVDLRSGECTLVQPGVLIHFKFKMIFDKTLPSDTWYGPSPIFQKRPIEINPQRGTEHLLPLQLQQFQSVPQTNEWEYVAKVAGTATDGEYQMTALNVLGRYPGPDGTVIEAPATLSDEAKREIAGYRVCVVHGFLPVGPAKGTILSVGAPKT